MLFMIGTGLNGEKSLTFEGLGYLKKCDYVFLDGYTSLFAGNLKDLDELIGKQVILADRKTVEVNANDILNRAKDSNAAFLVVGDVFSATTHTDLFLRAKELGMEIKVINNASVLTAVGITGLSLYKFGKIASIPFLTKDWQVDGPYDILKENKKMHTLFLLDLKSDKSKFMQVSEAIEFLFTVEERRKEKVFTENTLCVGVAALGTADQEIKVGKAKDLIKYKFKAIPQSLIIPAELHFIEEEMLNSYKL